FHVTGVQTCALPIFPAPHGPGVGEEWGPPPDPVPGGIRAGRAVGLHHPRQRGGALKKGGPPSYGQRQTRLMLLETRGKEVAGAAGLEPAIRDPKSRVLPVTPRPIGATILAVSRPQCQRGGVPSRSEERRVGKEGRRG